MVVDAFRFVDLFAGIGGFHAALSHAGGTCVYASEKDADARNTYRHNWAVADSRGIDEDITISASDDRMDVPAHDVLAAGFPCQPFSKSGRQLGMEETRGTLFWNIAKVLDKRRPAVVILENVRNLASLRHRGDWDTIIRSLRYLGYRVSSVPSVFSPHLLPPYLGGTPQARDRAFIVGTYVGVPRAIAEVDVSPTVVRAPVAGWDPGRWDIEWVLDDDKSILDLNRFRLTPPELEWIRTWDSLVSAYQQLRGERLPGFPLWSDLWHRARLTRAQLAAMPAWKVSFVEKNVAFYDSNRSLIDAWRTAHPALASFPATRRKLEWQAKDAESLWQTLMQLRPSGIRAKPPTYAPALVAMTQTSVVGRRRRRLTPRETARLQGLTDTFDFHNRSEAASYKQAGNGVAVGAVWHVLRTHVVQDKSSSRPHIPPHVRDAILAAPLNPSVGLLDASAYQVEPVRRDLWGDQVALA